MPPIYQSGSYIAIGLLRHYTSTASTYTLRVQELLEGDLREVRSVSFGANPLKVSAAGDGAALVQLMGPPFTLVEVTSAGEEVWAFTPFGPAFSEAIQSDAVGNWVATAAIWLEGEQIIQWFTNVRDVRRLAVLIDKRQGLVERVTEIAQPIGLIHGIRGTTSVLASTEGDGWRSLTVYDVTSSQARD
jgi:hypothetical protein